MTIRQHTLDTPYMVGPVHCYTAELGGDLVLFDTGPPTDHAREYLRNHVDLHRLKHVVITHCHIDHYGLASWLEEETDAAVYVPHRDGMKIKRHDERIVGISRLLENLGFSADYVGQLRRIFNSSLIFPPLPKKFRIVEDDLPDALGIGYMSCPGHSQSDLVLMAEDWAITGDVLLRGIFQSPLIDIDLETGDRFRNYDAYCETLRNLALLRDRRVMPGHRETIHGVDATILFYIDKMLERVVQLIPYAEDDNVARIIDRMFEEHPLQPFHIYLKVSEIVFMKDFLEKPETLRESLTAIGLFDSVADHFQAVLNHSGETP